MTGLPVRIAKRRPAMSEQDFFEELGDEAQQKIDDLKTIFGGYIAPKEEQAFLAGLEATIEALKEMMVGEPIGAEIIHSKYDDEHTGKHHIWTEIQVSTGGSFDLKDNKHHGTNGEEVYVLVARKEKK
jgi:hypothetical protein